MIHGNETLEKIFPGKHCLVLVFRVMVRFILPEEGFSRGVIPKILGT